METAKTIKVGYGEGEKRRPILEGMITHPDPPSIHGPLRDP